MVNSLAERLEIKNKEKLFEIFRVISWFDKNRWNSNEEFQGNYNLIKYFRNDLNDDEKLLTHWLSYITDRQMPFASIWSKGGFILSELAYNFVTQKEGIDNLLNEKNDSSFYRRKEDLQNVFNFDFEDLHRTVKGQKKPRYIFVSRKMVNGKPVKFASRFITDDMQMMKKTLIILDQNFERSFIRFISACIERFSSKQDFVRRTAAALNLLTYEFTRNRLDEDVKKFNDTFFDEEMFQKYFENFDKHATVNKKRVWCSIRDYLRNGSEFQKNLLDSLDKENAEKWREASNSMMDQIEIPGDVWNNNSQFSQNLLANVIEFDKDTKLADVIREAFEKTKNEVKSSGIRFYPEQFDFTFDFVPRMCSSPSNSINGRQCRICPFGEGCQTYCHQDRTKNCPVTAYACGYVTKCEPDGCLVKEQIAKNSCKMAMG